MADHVDRRDLVVGGPSDSASLVSHLSEQERLRRRLDDDRERLRVAVEQVRDAARELTPAGRIRAQPYAWVLGGLAVGFVLGWLTADSD